jgi:hypothetical protein
MSEIAAIARDYFDRHQAYGLMLAGDQISRATGRHEWADVAKWHRVRNRMRRLQAVKAAANRVEFASAYA